MTLKFESKNLNGPSGLADKLNPLIGDFNEKTDVLNSRHRRAFAEIEACDSEIEACDGEYVRNFEEMANRLHDAIMALQLEEDEDREEIFDAVRDTLTDELHNFVYGNMTFNLTFCEGGADLDWWEASTC